MAINPGPNDSCPCGSGKKFKNCHMNKKPRKWSINVKFQKPVTELGIKRLLDGTIQYFDTAFLSNLKKCRMKLVTIGQKRKK
jgi:hypothetical protein